MISARKILLLFLLALCLPAYSQKVLDSLEKKLETAPNDSLRFRILMRLTREYVFVDYPKCRQYADEATIVAKRIGSYKILGQLDFALAFLENLEGDYSDALKYHQQIVKLYVENKDSSQLSRALMDIGRDYSDLGEYDDGYFYLIQSLKVAKLHSKTPKSIDSLVMAIALHNIGEVFMEVGQFDMAESHIDASQKMSELIHDPEGTAYNFNLLGELFRKKLDFDQAEKHLKISLSEARRLKIGALIPSIQKHLARLYLDKEDFKRSLLYYDSVILFQTQIDNRFGLAECNLGKGMVMSRSMNYTEALKYYNKSLEAAKILHVKSLESSCYKELASVYEIKKDYETALRYHNLHETLKDSLFSEAILEKLFQNQMRFETETKDLMIAALSEAQKEQNSEIHRQELVRNILVIIVALSALILFTVYRSGQRRKRINRLLLEHQEEIKKRSIELEQLNEVKDKFFSIISHDLRSPMNALAGSLDLLEQKHLTQEEFLQLTQSLRTQFNHTRSLINNLLNWTLLQMDKLKLQPERVTLHVKVEESFNVLRTLFPKNIEMINTVPVSLAAMTDANIITLVLRNLILNAIKFTEAGGRIQVTAVDKENEILVSIADNGIGIKPEVKEHLFVKPSAFTTRGTANERGTGIGLMLCKEFVEKNGGRIWFESEVGAGTTFYFTLLKPA
jgi:signal transduction histidine kinase